MDSNITSTLGVTRCGNTEFRWGERTYIMGICNMSPDSFSSDGLDDVVTAVAQAKRLVAEGADIIDIGGESTRPGAEPLPAREELRRVIPVIERLAPELPVPISIDTYKSEVARRALAAGAKMINDISGLKEDPALAQVATEANVPLVLMSNQRYTNGEIKDVMAEIVSFLEQSIALAIQAGVPRENIIIDPGVGFGKTVPQNLEMIYRLAELKTLNRPILLGTSRKFMKGNPPDQRLGATAATLAIGIAHGADVVRVHEVKHMLQVCRMTDAIIGRRPVDH